MGCTGLSVRDTHGLVVDPDGRALSWGIGTAGKLGHGSAADVAVPQLIASLATERVVWVAVSAHHSMIAAGAGTGLKQQLERLELTISDAILEAVGISPDPNLNKCRG